jgi:hypothetical protein
MTHSAYVTHPQRPDAATIDLARIAAELEEARTDLALLERLKSANDRVTRLTAEQDKATKSRDKALAAQAKAEKEARFAGISDVHVSESPETMRENIIRSAFSITYTKPTWNGRSNPPTRHSAASFGTLPPEILSYLMDVRPDLIPAKIMALSSDSPREAFRRYFASCRRGYLAA